MPFHHSLPKLLSINQSHYDPEGGTSQACAACKYQRKRCTPECALAPHFRPEQTEIFKNAHKLFGVRNILRILEQVDVAHKNEAMRSIIYQANMRDRSPVHGCLGVIYQLQYQIRQAEKQLYSVISQLEFYKRRPVDDQSEQQLQLGLIDQPPTPRLTLFQNDLNHHQQQQQQQHFVPNFYNCENDNGNGNGNGGSVVANNVGDSKENVNMNMMNGNVMWGQQTYSQTQTQPLTIQEEVTHDYDEIYPFFDTFDDIDSKEANESSSESSPKDSADVARNNLNKAELQLGIVTEDYQTFA